MGGGDVQEADTIGPLYLDWTPGDDPPTCPVVVQLVVGLAAIVGGAHLFVEELINVAEEVGIEPLVLSLVLAPLATELPEKANTSSGSARARTASRSATSPGRWSSSRRSRSPSASPSPTGSSTSTRCVSGVLGLAGGVLAYWALRLRNRFEALPIVIWAGLFTTFLAYVAMA